MGDRLLVATEDIREVSSLFGGEDGQNEDRNTMP